VHIASACKNSGGIDARAGFGTYWGDNSRYNTALRVPGRQVDARAALLGVLYALETAREGRTLEIFLTSKQIIRAICYNAGKNYTTGWDCTNGDLLERIA
ncbi:hypothetical protein B0H16DRAFT_1231488, partial [Mycena metata]